MTTPAKPEGRPPKPAAPGIGERFRAARIEAGLTLAVLAERIDSKQTYVSRVELGKSRPSLEWLHRAAVAIGCKPSTLDWRLTDRLGAAPEPTPEEPA